MLNSKVRDREFLPKVVKTVTHPSCSHEQITLTFAYYFYTTQETMRSSIEMMKKLGQHKNIVNMIACRTKMDHFCW